MNDQTKKPQLSTESGFVDFHSKLEWRSILTMPIVDGDCFYILNGFHVVWKVKRQGDFLVQCIDSPSALYVPKMDFRYFAWQPIEDTSA